MEFHLLVELLFDVSSGNALDGIMKLCLFTGLVFEIIDHVGSFPFLSGASLQASQCRCIMILMCLEVQAIVGATCDFFGRPRVSWSSFDQIEYCNLVIETLSHVHLLKDIREENPNLLVGHKIINCVVASRIGTDFIAAAEVELPRFAHAPSQEW